MTAADDWRAMRERYERFSQTELGKLYRAYDKATIEYWRNDANENISNKRLKELDQIAREATNIFVAKLMELAGV
jgi:glucokinase